MYLHALVYLIGLLLGSLCLPPLTSAAEIGDVELSAYVLGSWPRDHEIFNQGTMAAASIESGIGAGLKVGLFPDAMNRMVGVEIDTNGHSGEISFPNTANGRRNGIGRSDLVILSTMVNLILRYPGETFRPYIGAGGGWSHAVLLDPDIDGRSDRDFDSARTFGYQALGGLQMAMNSKVFLFSEYRYFSAAYHWKQLAVDFHTHYGLIGAGLRF
ncbi:MAG: porin family protein [Nitrospira sp.]|nr:porin family protein [Nitrospira sp.]